MLVRCPACSQDFQVPVLLGTHNLIRTETPAQVRSNTSRFGSLIDRAAPKVKGGMCIMFQHKVVSITAGVAIVVLSIVYFVHRQSVMAESQRNAEEKSEITHWTSIIGKLEKIQNTRPDFSPTDQARRDAQWQQSLDAYDSAFRRGTMSETSADRQDEVNRQILKRTRGGPFDQ